MSALQLAALIGVVAATAMYYAIRVVILYDKQKGLGDVASRRSVYFSVAVGVAVAIATFLAAR